MLKGVLKLLFPDKCLVCGNVTISGIPVCSECAGAFSSLFANTCPACGKRRRECACGGGAFSQSGHFLFYYQSPASRAVISVIKHYLDSEGADFIAELVFQSLRDMKKFDAVVYPPRTEKNKFKYGYDQAECISLSIARKLGVEAKSALKRVRKAEEQKLLSASQRRKNMLGTFAADKKMLTGVRRVLLFDDVYTSGATTQACAAALRDAGVAEVVIFTVAYTPKKTRKKAARRLGTTVAGRVYRYGHGYGRKK